MSGNSKIEWTGSTWNPIRARVKGGTRWGYHCERISPGCQNCYAERMNGRMLPAWGTGLDYTVPNREKVEIFLDEDELLRPLSWKNPRKIFPCSMTDAFAEFVPDWMLDRMFAVAARTPQHTYQFLTKRADRMRRYLTVTNEARAWLIHLSSTAFGKEFLPIENRTEGFKLIDPFSWPPPNVHLGASVEDQQRANERYEPMKALAEQGWMTWVSYEPALEDVSFWGWAFLKWMVVGGESGPGARPFDLAWARHAIEQCKAAGIPVFVKQLGAKPEETITAPSDGHRWRRLVVLKDRKGGDMSEWPEWSRVREYPEASHV